MDFDALFSFANLAVLPGWALLVFLPRWKWTARLVASLLVPGLLALLYLFLVLHYFAGAEGGFGSLDDVARLFESRGMLLAGWVHYLAFDLFIGAWEVRDARRIGLHHLLVVPCLVLTFLLGPIGLLLYFLLRAVVRKRALIDETAA